MFPKCRAQLTSRRTVHAILVAGCVAGALAPAAAQAAPDANVSLSLLNVDPVRVGDARQGQLIVRNIGAELDQGTVNITDVTLVPSCGGDSNSTGTCLAADSADQDAIVVGPSASATSGTCATPAPFVVSPADDPGTGKVRFTPFPAGSSVGWSASGTTSCTITFNYTVAHMPVHDVLGLPGMQTNLVGYAQLSWTGAPLQRYNGAKPFAVTVEPDRPSLSARALPAPTLATGQSLYATGTLVDGTAPTGTLSFDLWKGELGCTDGAIIRTYTNVAMNEAGLGQTPSFVASEPGTYWWKATYAGDRDNAAVTSGCSGLTKVSAPGTTPPATPPPPAGAAPGDGTSGGTTLPGGATTPGTGTSGGTPGTGRTVPPAVKRVRLDAFALTRRSFARATTPTALAATAAYAAPTTKKKAAKKGTTIKYTLSAPATVAILVERVTRGRRASSYGNKCLKATKKLAKRKSCALYVKVSTLKRVHTTAGAKKVSFSGRAGRKALPVGKYRMRATANAGSAITASAERRTTFKIVKR